MIEAKNISFKFNEGKIVFEDLSFQVRNEIVSIVGPSGAGKSTLLKCLAAELQLTSGEILVDNEKLTGPDEKLLPGHEDIAIVDQDFSLDPHFNVEENIYNQLLHLTEGDRDRFTDELLDVFGLTNLRYHSSKHISGGEKQRLSMASALAKEPSYLLLDEPFSNLDVHLKKSIGRYLRKLQSIRRMGVVLVTHEGVDALSWSDIILFLKNQSTIKKYTPKSAYFKPQNLFEGRFFGELNSVYIEGKQKLFRPHQYSISEEENKTVIRIAFIKADFHGHYYANYYKLANGKEIVLYGSHVMKTLKKVYV